MGFDDKKWAQQHSPMFNAQTQQQAQGTPQVKYSSIADNLTQHRELTRGLECGGLSGALSGLSNSVDSITQYRGQVPIALPSEDAYLMPDGTKITMQAMLGQPQYKMIGLKEALGIKDEIKPKPGGNMLKEIKNDIQQIIREHKQAIYTLVFLYLVDRFVFEGHFKAKLKEVSQRLLGKAEAQLDKIGVMNEQQK